MQLIVMDYGETYTYDAFNFITNWWGGCTVEIEGFVEDLPWIHAQEVEAFVEHDGVRYSFDADVFLQGRTISTEERAVVNPELHAVSYEFEVIEG